MRILWILGDGKRGHENQSLGLAEAMARLEPWSLHWLELPHRESLLKRFARLREATALLPRPDVVVAAGHSTHGLLLYAGKVTAARTLVLMKPSLPLRWFDFCLLPQHDLKAGERLRSGCIPTLGAINRMRHDPAAKDGSGIVLIGGPAKAYAWDALALLEQIAAVVGSDPHRSWRVANSRRTPTGFLSAVKERLPQVEVFPVEAIPGDWLTHALAAAEVVWVGEDSVSMVYEALTAGAQVGILAMPRKHGESKHTRGIDALVEDKRVVTFAEWQKGAGMPSAQKSFNEADRCARLLLELL